LGLRPSIEERRGSPRITLAKVLEWPASVHDDLSRPLINNPEPVLHGRRSEARRQPSAKFDCGIGRVVLGNVSPVSKCGQIGVCDVPPP
jgi:hypothetical protein